ncbi:MAG: hypothetical protein AB7I48_18420, partial [Planctomycetaceae bacterium]
MKSQISDFKLQLAELCAARPKTDSICNLQLVICNLQSDFLLIALLCLTSPSLAQEPLRPPEDVVAADHPNDAGTIVDVRWRLSPDDSADRVPP